MRNITFFVLTLLLWVLKAQADEVACMSDESIKRFHALRNSSIPIPNTNLNSSLPLQPCSADGVVRDNSLLVVFLDDGDAYMGPIIDGKIQGLGELVMRSSGQTYLGFFKNNAYDGFGTVYDNNTGQIIAQGTFKNNQLVQSSAGQQNGSSLMQRLGNWGKAYQEYDRQNRGTNCTSTMQNGTVFTHCN